MSCIESRFLGVCPTAFPTSSALPPVEEEKAENDSLAASEAYYMSYIEEKFVGVCPNLSPHYDLPKEEASFSGLASEEEKAENAGLASEDLSMSCMEQGFVGVCPTLSPSFDPPEEKTEKALSIEDPPTEQYQVDQEADQKKKRWAWRTLRKKLTDMIKRLRQKKKAEQDCLDDKEESFSQLHDQESILEQQEETPAEKGETPAEKSNLSSAMHSVAKSFSMTSSASHLSKSFSNVSAAESTATELSEISGLVRFLSYRENIERGFEVLSEDFEGFNGFKKTLACAPPATNAEAAEEQVDSPLAESLEDTGKTHDEVKQSDEVANTAEATEPETTVEESTLDRDEASLDGEVEHRDAIPPQLSMQSHTSASVASRASKKSVFSQLSTLSKKSLKLQRSVSAASHKSSAAVEKTESNVSTKPKSVPSSMSTAPQPELIAVDKTSKSFDKVDSPSTAASAGAPEEVDEQSRVCAVTAE